MRKKPLQILCELIFRIFDLKKTHLVTKVLKWYVWIWNKTC